jgi:GDP-4-dehydro-6-deoxy-D-mannose reductase
MEKAKRMKKTAFVTGAEGFIGSHLIRFLHDQRWNVVAGYLPYEFKPPVNSGKIRFVQCDLRNGQRVKQLLEESQPSHVFHLGAQSVPTISWSDPIGTFESNVMGSLNLFEAIRFMKASPVVVSACSSAEYGHVPASAIPVTEEQPLRPLHPYGISKVVLDLLAREYFLDYSIRAVNLRLFNTTGPGKTNDAASDFVRQIVRVKKGLQPPVIEVGNLKPRRALLDVQDTVRGFFLAATKGRAGESYNLCAIATHPVGSILRTAIRLSGVKVKVTQVPRLMRPSDEKIIFGRTEKFREDTGWAPTISMEQTLTAMLDYWDRTL